MAVSPVESKQQAHDLLDRLGPGQLDAIGNLLRVMVDVDDDALTEEEDRAVAASLDYFRQNPEGGLSFEQVVAECGFTMADILSETDN